jgi:hypothetical protein
MMAADDHGQGVIFRALDPTSQPPTPSRVRRPPTNSVLLTKAQAAKQARRKRPQHGQSGTESGWPPDSISNGHAKRR